MVRSLRRQLQNVSAYDVYGPMSDTKIDTLYFDTTACQQPGDAIRREIFENHYPNAVHWIGHKVTADLAPFCGQVRRADARDILGKVIRLCAEPVE